jgi:hypothetical protein
VFGSFSVRLPQKKSRYCNVDQETSASPQTVLSRTARRDLDEGSITNKSGVSRRSKYSQNNLLQRSVLFTKKNADLEEAKLNDKEEEQENLKVTLAACHRKIDYLKGAIDASRTAQRKESRNLIRKLLQVYPV